jgi:hypothetical protein
MTLIVFGEIGPGHHLQKATVLSLAVALYFLAWFLADRLRGTHGTQA